MSNILIDTDAYKVSMWKQYPPGTKYVSSYIEARKNPYNVTTTFYGLSHILDMLSDNITKHDVEFAKRYWEAQNMPFNYDGWMKVVTMHNGYLPLEIRAVPEGTQIKEGNVLVQVVNTDPEFFWLTTWVETALLRVWYPTTVATQSKAIKQLIRDALEQSADDADAEILFKLHDFGARGVSSAESAGIGGSAHLLNFMGTDTGQALFHAMTYYGAPMNGVAASIPASEHSTITSWGRKDEVKAFENMLDQFGDGLVACVSDSYNVYDAVQDLWGNVLKEKIENMDGMLVVRPDSGDPTKVPVEIVEMLDLRFGHTVNSKGYKVLNNVRVIQGDGVDYNSIRQIVVTLLSKGYSISNIAFGMGGALLQKVDRDVLGFAMKANAAYINDEWVDVFKDPITDNGKKSKKGRLALIKEAGGDFKTIRRDELVDPRANQLELRYRNGDEFNVQQWNDVVSRARA